jgi:hypothetical protein
VHNVLKRRIFFCFFEEVKNKKKDGHTRFAIHSYFCEQQQKSYFGKKNLIVCLLGCSLYFILFYYILLAARNIWQEYQS